ISPDTNLAAGKPRRTYGATLAYTLVEVMVMLMCVCLLIGGLCYTIVFMSRSSLRLADYTSAMSLIEAKLHEIRAATYNPPTYPFTATNTFITNTGSISLDQSGTTYRITGNIVSQIQPTALGHLVTVTATFQEPSGTPLTVSLQSLVNHFSGGQGAYQ
ncbi:MAG TPA: hypothetical protein VFC07_08005, partial [Verrucomicrobiae bacterium]|nr:hypothetical protein [Verrucomicrobiae bacterium]